MNKLSIKVQILDRMFPLTIDPSEEEIIRKAAKMVNSKLSMYKKGYSDRDNQDILSMCLLQLTMENIMLNDNNDSNSSDEKVDDINNYLTEQIEKLRVL